jgi:hypothetical protein
MVADHANAEGAVRESEPPVRVRVPVEVQFVVVEPLLHAVALAGLEVTMTPPSGTRVPSSIAATIATRRGL